MPSSGPATSAAVYALVAALPRLDHCAHRDLLPANGVYLMFERGELLPSGVGAPGRIVRVGTHRIDGRLPRRIGFHFGGDRRTSVLRRHLGAALLARDGAHDPRLPAWLNPDAPALPEVEERVGEVLRDNFTFACIRVDRADERLSLERSLIALLARHPLAEPSPGWLGRHAAHPAISKSGLWNTQGLDAEPLVPKQVDRLADLIASS